MFDYVVTPKLTAKAWFKKKKKHSHITGYSGFEEFVLTINFAFI